MNQRNRDSPPPKKKKNSGIGQFAYFVEAPVYLMPLVCTTATNNMADSEFCN